MAAAEGVRKGAAETGSGRGRRRRRSGCEARGGEVGDAGGEAESEGGEAAEE